MATTPLAQPADVAAIWSAYTAAQAGRLEALIAIASAKLRKAAAFDIDERIAQFGTDPTASTALDPVIVANVVATIVQRFLVNPNGVASTSETTGPYANTETYVNRFSGKGNGADVRGQIRVTADDLAELLPTVATSVAGSIRLGIPAPRILDRRSFEPGGTIRPDIFIDQGIE